MKAIIIKLVIVALMLITIEKSSGIDTKSKRTGVIFTLNPGQSPFDPLQYTVYGGSDPEAGCPGDGRVCMIDVSASDLYTALDAPTPVHVGKPKVDINTSATNELFDQIQKALETSGEQDPSERINGRIIYEQGISYPQ